MNNSDKLHQENVINKEQLKESQVKAIDGLTSEEVDHMINITSKLKNQLDEEDHDITGVPF